MNFGEALKALGEGKQVQRAGWNGKGMYVVQMPGYDSIPCNENTARAHHIPAGEPVSTAPYLVLRAVAPQDCKTKLFLVPGWLASQTDMLADDWSVLPD